MIGFLLRRLAVSLLLLFLLLSLTFFLVRLAPGDPTKIYLQDSRLPGPARDQLLHAYGLDRPFAEQYVRWLTAVVRDGNWGISFTRQEAVTRVIAGALPNTALLALSALLVEYSLALPLGIYAARHPRGRRDQAVRVVSVLLFSLPTFWLGYVAILAFAAHWPLFPPSSMHSIGAEDLSAGRRLADVAWHLALPALVLGATAAGGTARFVRASLLEILDQDYVRTARAKGLSERRVLWVHALRNALVPITQILGLSLPFLLNGSLVTEVVFAWPGLGLLTFGAAQGRDYPLILGTTALTGALVILGNLLADLLHAAVDPRVRRA